MANLDIVKAELVRKSLEAVAGEMAITLMRTSGSPVVTDGKDFSMSLLNLEGQQIAFSGYAAFHISTSFLGVESVLNRYGAALLDEISPGDGFLMNDPHTSGAIHQGDCGFVMPWFDGDEFIAWGHVSEHVLDVGGTAVSGFAPEARDCFSEALRFSGNRVVRNGKLDSEWERFIETNVRTPGPVLNDLRSMIAAQNVGRQRLLSLIREYGREEFWRYTEWNLELTENLIRAKFAALPDGTYISWDWVEYDGHGKAELFPVTLEFVIEGDEATLRFAGAPQQDCFINATRPVVLGQAMTSLLCQLFYDVPVNGGIWRAIHFDLGPTGTIVNATAPAPTTQGHMETGMRINKLVTDVISQAVGLSGSTELRSRVAGQPSNGAVSTTLAGIDRRSGRPSIMFPMSPPHCMGQGAQTSGDGLDTYGSQASLGNGVPAVEIEESTAPMVVLWRRILTNSGGAGIRRGGQGASIGIAMVGADQMRGTGWTSVSEIPPGGASGGLPGGAADYYLIQDTTLLEMLQNGVMPAIDNLGGKAKLLAAKTGSLSVLEGDCFVFSSCGGGGLGDPIARDPADVAWDVKNGFVSIEMAYDVYGVVTDGLLVVDKAASAERRREIRTQRLGGAPSAELATELVDPVQIGLGVHRSDEEWSCSYCLGSLGSIEGNFRSTAVERRRELKSEFAKHEMFVRRRPEGEPLVSLREFFCPHCAYCLVVDVAPDDCEMMPAPSLR